MATGSGKRYDVAVIGAGINGLCAVFHLLRRGVSRVALIEQFDLGHTRGSSHGQSRITRSAYINKDYTHLMQVAHKEEWPRLEQDLGACLIHRIDGCYYGPAGGIYDSYAASVARVGVDVEEVTAEEARKSYPQLRFPDSTGVLIDRTGGFIAAAETVRCLSDLARRKVDVLERCRVRSIDPGTNFVRIDTNAGFVDADHLIVAAGPWATRLVPALSARLTVTRQVVGYFEMEGPPGDYEPGPFPVWGYLGGPQSVTFYGLPRFGKDGIKVARHVTGGRRDDPDRVPAEFEPDCIEDLRDFVSEHFSIPARRLVRLEHCHYTNTQSEDFIIDFHPDDDRIVVAAGFSGHGFKFGPVTGRVLASLALDGESDLPEFSIARDRFRL